MDTKKFSRETKKQSESDMAQFEAMEKVFKIGSELICDKIDAFPKYATRQSIAKFLTKYEIFKKILHVNGSIVECGVLYGGGANGVGQTIIDLGTCKPYPEDLRVRYI